MTLLSEGIITNEHVYAYKYVEAYGIINDFPLCTQREIVHIPKDVNREVYKLMQLSLEIRFR